MICIRSFRFRLRFASSHVNRMTYCIGTVYIRQAVWMLPSNVRVLPRRAEREAAKCRCRLTAAEVTAFLSWLATERNVAAATQNQAEYAAWRRSEMFFTRPSCL